MPGTTREFDDFVAALGKRLLRRNVAEIESLASSTTSVVLNGDAALIARPNSTKISFGKRDDRRIAVQAKGLHFERHGLARFSLHVDDFVGFDLLEKRQLARADAGPDSCGHRQFARPSTIAAARRL